MSAPSRTDRMSGAGPPDDQRKPFQIDRDRILYSTAFLRLAGVTQVVSPAEGEVFHNRLTHTLKVAQIARRLAEMLLDQSGGKELAEAWGGIDPEVVEAAALAHDLGHPPFGHIAEDELNNQVAQIIAEARPKPKQTQLKDPTKVAEGYEGNAQSFRIITTLAVRRPAANYGLDLTRATLNATLKYPRGWSKHEKKYGVYESEKNAFDFARAGPNPGGPQARCIEAQIMDWADDITYSVHDTEDFYRAGLIPLDGLAVNPKERARFMQMAVERRESIGKPLPEKMKEILDIFNNFFESIPIKEPYNGTRSQREALYQFTSAHINELVQNTKLTGPPGEKGEGISVDPDFRTRVELLKELTWCYVINNPALASHQHGQRKAIRTLFEVFNEAAEEKKWVLFPPLFREEAEQLVHKHGTMPAQRSARLVADTIASMNDQQALRLYQRLMGTAQGSVLDPIIT